MTTTEMKIAAIKEYMHRRIVNITKKVAMNDINRLGEEEANKIGNENIGLFMARDEIQVFIEWWANKTLSKCVLDRYGDRVEFYVAENGECVPEIDAFLDNFKHFMYAVGIENIMKRAAAE